MNDGVGIWLMILVESWVRGFRVVDIEGLLGFGRGGISSLCSKGWDSCLWCKRGGEICWMFGVVLLNSNWGIVVMIWW